MQSKIDERDELEVRYVANRKHADRKHNRKHADRKHRVSRNFFSYGKDLFHSYDTGCTVSVSQMDFTSAY